MTFASYELKLMNLSLSIRLQTLFFIRIMNHMHFCHCEVLNCNILFKRMNLHIYVNNFFAT